MRSTLRNEQGIAFIVEIILGAVVLAVIGVAVFVFLQHRSGGTSSLIPAKVTLSSKCELNDAELCRFVNNWKVQENYTAKSTETTKEGTSQSAIMISGKGNSQMTTSQNSKEAWNVITIGNTTYTKDYTDGKWWKQTVEPSKAENPEKDFDFGKDDTDKSKPEAQKTQYKAMGKEACGKLRCFKYQVIEPGQTGTSYIFFDDRDYLLRKMTNTTESGTSTTEFSYDKVSIKEPSPVKTAAPDQVIVPGGGTFAIPTTAPTSVPDDMPAEQ